jgi:hypothetical protein
VSPITTLPNYFLSNLPKSLRNYTSSGKKGRKQLNATIIIMEHTITHPTPIFPKTFHLVVSDWSLVSHKFRVFFLSVVNFVSGSVSVMVAKGFASRHITEPTFFDPMLV